MSLKDYLRVLGERWLTVTLAVIMGVAAAAAVFLTRPVEYTATLSMYVSSQSGETPQSALQGAELSSQRIKSYTELATSTRVGREVVRRLGLNESPEQVAEKITATSDLDSVVIDVAVTDASPQQAARIANVVGVVFGSLVQELERPARPDATTPVAIRVVQEAIPPVTPSSSGPERFLLVGLLAGLLVGVVAALLRNALDGSIRRPRQLQDVVGEPVLGVIALDSDSARRPLTVAARPRSQQAEAFRRLRANLQFADPAQPPQVVVVTSAVAGEGKTTTVLNLSHAFASSGRSVLMVEADLRRPRLANLLGISSATGLTDVLAGHVAADLAIHSLGDSRPDVLLSGELPANPGELLASASWNAFVEHARTAYDLMIIDTPPLVPVTDAAVIAPRTDGVLLVCRYKQTGRTQIEAVVDSLDAVSARIIGAVLTMVPRRRLGVQRHADPAYTHDGLAPRQPEPVAPSRVTSAEEDKDATTGADMSSDEASREAPSGVPSS